MYSTSLSFGNSGPGGDADGAEEDGSDDIGHEQAGERATTKDCKAGAYMAVYKTESFRRADGVRGSGGTCIDHHVNCDGHPFQFSSTYLVF
jgi:hypothetical protein